MSKKLFIILILLASALPALAGPLDEGVLNKAVQEAIKNSNAGENKEARSWQGFNKRKSVKVDPNKKNEQGQSESNQENLKPAEIKVKSNFYSALQNEQLLRYSEAYKKYLVDVMESPTMSVIATITQTDPALASALNNAVIMSQGSYKGIVDSYQTKLLEYSMPGTNTIQAQYEVAALKNCIAEYAEQNENEITLGAMLACMGDSAEKPSAGIDSIAASEDKAATLSKHEDNTEGGGGEGGGNKTVSAVERVFIAYKNSNSGGGGNAEEWKKDIKKYYGDQTQEDDEAIKKGNVIIAYTSKIKRIEPEVTPEKDYNKLKEEIYKVLIELMTEYCNKKKDGYGVRLESPPDFKITDFWETDQAQEKMDELSLQNFAFTAYTGDLLYDLVDDYFKKTGQEPNCEVFENEGAYDKLKNDKENPYMNVFKEYELFVEFLARGQQLLRAIIAINRLKLITTDANPDKNDVEILANVIIKTMEMKSVDELLDHFVAILGDIYVFFRKLEKSKTQNSGSGGSSLSGVLSAGAGRTDGKGVDKK